MSSKISAKNRLYELHPDFDEVRRSVEYEDWLNNVAAKPFRDALLHNTTDGDAAAQAIDMFKLYYKWGKAKRIDTSSSQNVKTGKAAVSDQERQPKIWTASEIKALSQEEFEKVEDELDLAQREGRVDMSR